MWSVWSLSLYFWLTSHETFLFLSLASSIKFSTLSLLAFTFSPLEIAAFFKVKLNLFTRIATHPCLLRLKSFIWMRSSVWKGIWRTNVVNLIYSGWHFRSQYSVCPFIKLAPAHHLVSAFHFALSVIHKWQASWVDLMLWKETAVLHPLITQKGTLSFSYG